jgi:hypothetical protein
MWDTSPPLSFKAIRALAPVCARAAARREAHQAGAFSPFIERHRLVAHVVGDVEPAVGRLCGLPAAAIEDLARGLRWADRALFIAGRSREKDDPISHSSRLRNPAGSMSLPGADIKQP